MVFATTTGGIEVPGRCLYNLVSIILRRAAMSHKTRNVLTSRSYMFSVPDYAVYAALSKMRDFVLQIEIREDTVR